jgi:predicted DsbA family dithiol-disulfide isomerase
VGEDAFAPVVRIRHFTDPGCPFAFSAEPIRLVLIWRYGRRLDWETRMVVLSETPPADFTPEKQSAMQRSLFSRVGMPIDWTPRRVAATAPACRVVVAARRHAPDRADALLRHLRALAFAGNPLDEPATLERAAAEAGLAWPPLAAWAAEPETEAALCEDMALARSPSAAARAQDAHLSGPPGERRYSCPSYELSGPGGVRVDVAGFRPLDAYEVAVANLAPELSARPSAESAEEALAWAGLPLATVEVAALLGRGVEDTRVELARTARFAPVGGDGYWIAG